LGIKILAVIHAIRGIGILALGFVVLRPDRAAQISAQMGIPGHGLALIMFALGAYLLASTVGMFMAKPWGWWFGVSYYGFAAVRTIFTLVMIPAAVRQLPEPPENLGFYVGRYIGRLIVLGLVAAYFFKPSVLSAFKVGGGSKRRLVAILVGGAAVAFGIWLGADHLIFRD
jgi:hypothetical protein